MNAAIANVTNDHIGVIHRCRSRRKTSTSKITQAAEITHTSASAGVKSIDPSIKFIVAIRV
jgi:hypothetical protein